MKLRVRSLLLILLIPCLAGCWDQRELKELRIEQAEAFDLLENNKIKFTISIPTIKSSSQSKSSIVVPIVSGEGRTVNEAYLEMKKNVSQELDFGKVRVVLINKQLASKGFYPALESYYREAHSPINAKMAIVDQSASELLHLKVADRLMISEYLHDLLQIGEINGLIPKASPYIISSMFTHRGTDAAIPIIKPKGSDRVEIAGLALFHDKRMTGELGSDEAMKFVMLSKFNPEYFTVTEYVKALNTNVSLFMVRDKRHISITTANGAVKAVISASFTCDLVEVPYLTHIDEQVLKKVASELEQKLTESAKAIIKKLQRANCDALGVGLQVKAHRYHYWKSISWDKAFPEIEIEPKIKVSIDKHGIME